MNPVIFAFKFSPFLFITCIFAAILGFSTQTGATEQDNPDRFIKSLADEAIAVLSNQENSLDEREEKFRAVLRDDFAMEKISRFAAGKYWRRMNKAQKAEYQSLFEEWVLKTYSIRFGGYTGQSVDVQKTIKAGQADVFVRTNFGRERSRSITIDWRVRRINNRFKIIDVVVEGVSMLVTQKAEFGAVLRQRGVDGLIRILRLQLDRMAAAKAN
jgi:phospholipid transport system substrate-binding protein